MDTHTSAEAIFAYLQGLIVMAKAQNDPDVILVCQKGSGRSSNKRCNNSTQGGMV